MAVTQEQVRKTAALARVNIGTGKNGEDCAQATEKLAVQIDNILDYMNILSSINTDNIEPLYSPMLHISEPREDEALRKLTPKEVLQNAPESSETFFVVPPVLS